jgi:hypothetical protein
VIDKILFEIAVISGRLFINDGLRIRFRKSSPSISISRTGNTELTYRAIERVGRLRILRKKESVITVEDCGIK